MLRQLIGYPVVIAFAIVFTNSHALANGCADASAFSEGQQQADGSKGKTQDKKQEGQVDEQGQAHADNCNALQDTMSDMSGGGGGGGGEGLLGGLLGGALGALGAMMAAKSAKKDLEKKLEEAEKEAKEAEERIQDNIDQKFDEAAQQQEESFNEFKEELKDELAGGGGANQGEEPPIGANGLAADIENAFAAGDLATVSAIINDPLNRELLPAEYIAEIEQRIILAGGSVSSATFAQSIGVSEEQLDAGILAASEVAGDIPVSDGLDSLGNSIFGVKSATAPQQGRKPANFAGLSVRQLVSDGQYNILHAKVSHMIESGSMASLNAAAKHIEDFSLSSDPQMVTLSDELRVSLNTKLESMGLPTGQIGLSLLSN